MAIALFGLIVSSCCVVAAFTQPKVSSLQEDKQTFLGVQVTDARHMHVTEVTNIVNNMLSGDVSASDAHDYIFDEKFFAGKAGEKLSGKELDQNKRYIEFLNAADAVVTAYIYDSPDVKDKVAEMEAKKELI